MNDAQILFYSNKCKYCRDLIKILSNESLIPKTLICTDNNLNLPKDITQTPTLIVSNINEPLVGKKAFEWVKTKKQFNQPSNNIKYASSLIFNETIMNSHNDFANYDSNDAYAFIADDKETNTIWGKAGVEDKIIVTVPELDAINKKIQTLRVKQRLSERKKKEKALSIEKSTNKVQTIRQLCKKKNINIKQFADFISHKKSTINQEPINNQTGRLLKRTIKPPSLGTVNHLIFMGWIRAFAHSLSRIL